MRVVEKHRDVGNFGEWVASLEKDRGAGKRGVGGKEEINKCLKRSVDGWRHLGDTWNVVSG